MMCYWVTKFSPYTLKISRFTGIMRHFLQFTNFKIIWLIYAIFGISVRADLTDKETCL